MSNLLNILQNNEVPIENQQIIDYLQGQLQADAQHKVEETEQQDEMMLEAMEGLMMLEDKSRLDKMTRDINLNLQQRITEQKHKRRKINRWKDQNWITMSVVTILLLIVVCYLIIRLLKH